MRLEKRSTGFKTYFQFPEETENVSVAARSRYSKPTHLFAIFFNATIAIQMLFLAEGNGSVRATTRSLSQVFIRGNVFKPYRRNPCLNNTLHRSFSRSDGYPSPDRSSGLRLRVSNEQFEWAVKTIEV